MNPSENKRKRKILIIAVVTLIILATVAGACAIYLCDYYRADNEAIGAFMRPLRESRAAVDYEL